MTPQVVTTSPVNQGFPRGRSVFVMMRYGDAVHYQEIETTIRQTLHEYDLTAYWARDRTLAPLLWQNVRAYLDACSYGIAVFEKMESLDFNPNVSLELGYLLAQAKPCLLLKEKGMPRLPTDMVGHLYKDFDMESIRGTVTKAVAKWAEEQGFSAAGTRVRRSLDVAMRQHKLSCKLLELLYRSDVGLEFRVLEKGVRITGGSPTRERLMVELRTLADMGLIRQHVNERGGWLYTMENRAREVLGEFLGA